MQKLTHSFTNKRQQNPIQYIADADTIPFKSKKAKMITTAHRFPLLLCLLVFILNTDDDAVVDGFSIPSSTAAAARRGAAKLSVRSLPLVSMSSPSSTDQSSSTGSDFSYRPLFNFSNVDENAVDKFERIDDAIMGGISLSSIKQMPGEDFARWSGICRTDGGGFCGTRTLPFERPLQVGNDSDGIYLKCKFTSDDEPQRRVWKLTTRTEASRGEQLYQAMFEYPSTTTSSSDKDSDDGWETVLVPFSSFAQVRGPRLVQDAPPLNTTGGLYQIGMTMSKFQMGANTTEIPNFRPGFFEMQLREVGVYSSSSSSSSAASSSASSGDRVSVDLGEAAPIKTLSKEEVQKKRPVMLKILSPVFKVLFNEKRRRRASAARILKNKKKFSKLQLIKYGFRNRVARKGLFGGLVETIGVGIQDVCSFILGWTLRLVVFYPFVFASRFIKLVTKPLTGANKKTKQEPDLTTGTS